jgi:2-polyprenyl-3-methyl-5-hydroxy-6-metoxy-1,4-benzoquinol methylase
VLRVAEKERALGYYSRIANGYHRRVARGPLIALRRRERKTVLQLARLAPGLSLADVGCGSGYYALEAKRRGLRVCAIDALPQMLEQLDGQVDELHLRDLESLARWRVFDRVICAGVLDFVADVPRAFANLCSLVAPGGWLVVLVPSAGPGGWLYKAEKALFGLRVNLFDPEWLRQRLRQHGLRPVDLRRPLPGNLALSAKRI